MTTGNPRGATLPTDRRSDFSDALAEQILHWVASGHTPIALKFFDLLKNEKHRKLLDFGIEVERRMPDSLRIGFIENLKIWMASSSEETTIMHSPRLAMAYELTSHRVNLRTIRSASFSDLVDVLIDGNLGEPQVADGSVKGEKVKGVQPDIDVHISDKPRISVDDSTQAILENSAAHHRVTPIVEPPTDGMSARSALIIGVVVMFQILVVYFSIFL